MYLYMVKKLVVCFGHKIYYNSNFIIQKCREQFQKHHQATVQRRLSINTREFSSLAFLLAFMLGFRNLSAYFAYLFCVRLMMSCTYCAASFAVLFQFVFALQMMENTTSVVKDGIGQYQYSGIRCILLAKITSK